uniref:hypothetical protein n=1 Tax=Thiosulfatihalobacter marinus TaxID=2792481 RepID=UPI0018D6B22E
QLTICEKGPEKAVPPLPGVACFATAGHYAPTLMAEVEAAISGAMPMAGKGLGKALHQTIRHQQAGDRKRRQPRLETIHGAPRCARS